MTKPIELQAIESLAATLSRAVQIERERDAAVRVGDEQRERAKAAERELAEARKALEAHERFVALFDDYRLNENTYPGLIDARNKLRSALPTAPAKTCECCVLPKAGEKHQPGCPMRAQPSPSVDSARQAAVGRVVEAAKEWVDSGAGCSERLRNAVRALSLPGEQRSEK